MVAAYAANNASDNSSNYTSTTFTTGSNGGTGFEPWFFNDTSSGGQFIGASGESASSFGFFAGGSGQSVEDERPFTGFLGPGQTFSVDLGIGAPFTMGGVGIFLGEAGSDDILFEASGPAHWLLNDGGGLFSTSIPKMPATAASGPEPLTFKFTYNGGSSYSVLITEGSTIFSDQNVTATNPINRLDTVTFFSLNQDSGGNLGADNLSISTVPEPRITLLFLSGLSLLGGLRLIRRAARSRRLIFSF